MSLSIQSANFNYPLEINESRIGRLLSSDKNYATYMGIWDRIKDFFRPQKKAEVLEQTYTLIHNDHLEKTNEHGGKLDSLRCTLSAFEKLKSLAIEENKKLFRIEKNHYNGIDFYIGSTLVKSLDNYAPAYYMHQLNHHSELKRVINEKVTDALIINNAANKFNDKAPERLLNDMLRLSGDSAIDGISIASSHATPDHITELTNTFYSSLTVPQRAALLEVGSQSGFAYVFDSLSSVSNDFINNFILMCVSPSTTLQHNADSSDIAVFQTIRRMPNNGRYQEAKQLFSQQDCYPVIQMDTAFIISEDGKVDCVRFHVSDNIGASLCQ